MELTVDDYRSIIEAGFHRCWVAQNIGGLAERDRVEMNIPPPAGWHLDMLTCYWIPPHVDLDALCVGKPH